MLEIQFSNWDPFHSFPQALRDKKKVLLLIAIVCTAIILPLKAKDFSLGHYWHVATGTLFVLALWINTFSVYRNARLLIHENIAVLLLTLDQLQAVYYFGTSVIFWLSPIIVAIIFILPIRSANIFTALLIGGASYLTFTGSEAAVAYRAVMSLVLTWLLAGAILTTMRRMSEALRQQSIKDPRSKAYNKRMLDFLLLDCLLQKQRNRRNATILHISIDHWQNWQDKLGPVGADELFENFSELLMKHCRGLDILCRLPNDEFLLLCRDCERDAAEELAKRLCSRIRTTHFEHSTQVTASIGIAALNAAVSTEQWLMQARLSLEKVREAGGDHADITPANNLALNL
jgi:diguanylate cyclase (GGDEF)-like protein